MIQLQLEPGSATATRSGMTSYNEGCSTQFVYRLVAKEVDSLV